MTRQTGSRAAVAAKGLAALAAVVVLVVGVPAGLWAAVGWPLSDSVPQWGDVTRALSDTYVPDVFLVNALAVVCWLAWAELVAALAVETVAAIRRRPALRVPLAGPLQTAAAHLVAAVLLLGTLTGPRPAAAVPPPLPTVELVAADPLLAAPAPPPSAPPSISGPIDAPAPAEEAAPLPTYTAQRLDDLWSIAERHLADPYRWTDIWDLNRGRTFDGTTFRDPDLIHPGWTLDLPRDAIGLKPPPSPEPAASQPPPQERTEPPPEHTDDVKHDDDLAEADRDADVTPPIPTPRPTATPETCPPSSGSEQPDGSPTPEHGGQTDSTGGDTAMPDSPLSVELPSGTVVGLSFAAGVATSLAAARLHQRRQRLPVDPAPGIRRSEPLAGEPARRLRRAHLAATQAVAQQGDGGVGPGADHADAPAGSSDTVLASRRAEPRMALDPFEFGAIALTGPADATARAIVADVLAAPRHGPTEVVLTSTAADRLLPHTAPFPGLDVVDRLDATVTRLEIELIHRTRLLDATNTPDFAALTRRHPEEPAPALLLITDAPHPALQPRLAAVLSLGRRLGISALILGRCADLPTLTVAGDGHVQTVEPADSLSELRGAQLATLNTDDATELLRVIAAGRGADDHAPSSDAETEPFPVEPAAPTAPIAVTLLGPPRIEADDAEISTGLRSKARELLAFFLLHPHGATLETAVDALWPDADPQRGVERFRTVLGNLRSTLRVTAGLGEAGIIDRVGERYQADATLINCDLWRFEIALTEAAATTDDAAGIEALERAAVAYGGDLCDGAYYEWVEASREDLRRRAVDATARLAELRQAAGDSDGALDALDMAIRHDPYAEELYRRIMRLQADLGRTDAVRRTYRLLETRLTDLDIEPDDATNRLLTDLLAER